MRERSITFRSISGFALPSLVHNNQPLLQVSIPIFETSATALCGTTGKYTYELEISLFPLAGVVFFPLISLVASDRELAQPRHDISDEVVVEGTDFAWGHCPKTSMKDHIVRSDMRTGIFYRPPRKRLPYLLQADPHLDPPEVATGQSMVLRTSSFVVCHFLFFRLC